MCKECWDSPSPFVVTPVDLAAEAEIYALARAISPFEMGTAAAAEAVCPREQARRVTCMVRSCKEGGVLDGVPSSVGVERLRPRGSGSCFNGLCPSALEGVSKHACMPEILSEASSGLLAAAREGMVTFSVCLTEHAGGFESAAAATLVADALRTWTCGVRVEASWLRPPPALHLQQG